MCAGSPHRPVTSGSAETSADSRRSSLLRGGAKPLPSRFVITDWRSPHGCSLTMPRWSVGSDGSPRGILRTTSSPPERVLTSAGRRDPRSFRMPRFRLLVAATLVLALGGATPLLAATAGSVSGQALDAVGRPLAGVRIELVHAVESRPVGVPARVQRTDAQGAWSFGSVPAGEYVVRMSHRDRTTGVPVSVADSTGAPGGAHRRAQPAALRAVFTGPGRGRGRRCGRRRRQYRGDRRRRCGHHRRRCHGRRGVERRELRRASLRGAAAIVTPA